MKRLFIIRPLLLLLLLVISSLKNFGQTNPAIIKYYAYEQVTIGGTQQIDENGHPVSRADKEYFILLEMKKGFEPVINSFFVHGKSYKFNISKVSTPLEVTQGGNNGGIEQKILVPKTNNIVWRIWPTEIVSSKAIPAKLKTMVRTNDLVITGTINKKPFTQIIKKITVLDPVMYP